MQIEWIDVVLAVVVGAIIVFPLLLLKETPHDEKAVKCGGLVGFYLYRVGRWVANIFERKKDEKPSKNDK